MTEVQVKALMIKAKAYDQIKAVLMGTDDPATAGILALTVVVDTEKDFLSNIIAKENNND